jgi:SAM-dependent methyltransferase
VSLRAKAGRRLLFALRAPGDRRRDVQGTCSVCGRETRFVYNAWMLPDDMKRDLGEPALVHAFAMRESLFCDGCGSNLRVRRIAEALLELYGRNARTLVELVQEPGFRGLAVAEINSIGSIHGVLAAHSGLVYSEFRPGAALGAEVDGARNEDVCRLSYDDAAFDLVLTSDTLEHVPDLARALREIRRVLRPGGRHVFTVPIVPTRATSEVRAHVGPDGAVVHRLPARHHGRGSGPFRLVGRKGDLLVFTDIGMDVVELLGEAGFDTEVRSSGDGDAAIVLCATAVQRRVVLHSTEAV